MRNRASTIKDIAREVGVAPSTVSRALSGNPHITEDTKKKIMACAERLEYEPNCFARSLKGKGSGIIAFIVPNIENMIYPCLVHPVAEEARRRGYMILLSDTSENTKIALASVSAIKRKMVDGFIFSTSAMTGEEKNEINLVREDGFPYVALLRESGYGNDSIIADNRGGGITAVDYLVSKGKKRIVYLSGQSELLLYKERFEGYKKGLEKNGIAFDSNLVWEGFRNGEKIAYESVRREISRGNIPDAIFGASDPLAADAICALLDAGLKVPSDVSVMGFDNLPICEMLSVKLTTVAQPFREMGRAAVNMLIDKIEGRTEGEDENVIFPVRVVERDSVA